MRSLSDLRVQTYTIIQLQVEPQMIKEGPMRYLVVSLSILIFSKLTIFWRYYSQGHFRLQTLYCTCVLTTYLKSLKVKPNFR